MDREQMVKLGAEAISEWECGHGSCWSRAVLDAILPQITTVEELEALPVGTKLFDRDGEFLIKISDRLQFKTELDEYVSAEELADDISEDGDPLWAPLTVVWRP